MLGVSHVQRSLGDMLSPSNTSLQAKTSSSMAPRSVASLKDTKISEPSPEKSPASSDATTRGPCELMGASVTGLGVGDGDGHGDGAMDPVGGIPNVGWSLGVDVGLGSGAAVGFGVGVDVRLGVGASVGLRADGLVVGIIVVGPRVEPTDGLEVASGPEVGPFEGPTDG
eukprot:scaffold1596_cov302-Pinguiococcus_pyrenoidosus.AAC.27